jgi:hypothetical protein
MTINILELNQVCDITQEVYFDIVDHFGIAKKCIEHDPDNEDGTRNTEYGEELYNLIEYAIKNAIDYQGD